jgi:hypothetical protein
MPDRRAPFSSKAIEAMKARFLKEQEDKFYRDMAEAQRLAAEYPDFVAIVPGGEVVVAQVKNPQPKAPTRPEPNEHPALDGTIRSLIARYQSDPNSGYSKAHFKTRENYAGQLKRVLEVCGDAKLADLKAQDIQGFYEGWKQGGKEAMAHSLATMLRMLFGYGATTLGDDQCERLSVVMHKMRFPVSKRRSERLTAEQAKAIRTMAHNMKRPSIALAQALQFDCGLKQKDVIGEWTPIAEQGWSDVIHEGQKWLRGLRWSEIEDNLLLRHSIDLRQAPMVMEELALLSERPTTGPMIVCEFTKRPWTNHEFRRWWRKVADAAGVPKTVHNMDSWPRASAVIAGESKVTVEAKTVRATEGRPL